MSTNDSTEVEVINAARALLNRITNITSHDFSLGGEKAERERLEAAIKAYDDARLAKAIFGEGTGRSHRYPAADETRCNYYMGWDDFCQLVEGHNGSHALTPNG